MIRLIHPFYLLAMMILLLVALVWKNSQIKDEISYIQHQRLEARALAKRIIELKKVMNAPQKKELDDFLESSVFSNSDVRHRVKNGRYIINAKHMNARQLLSVLNRVLNMSVKVSQLKIESSDDRHVSFYMEINL